MQRVRAAATQEGADSTRKVRDVFQRGLLPIVSCISLDLLFPR